MEDLKRVWNPAKNRTQHPPAVEGIGHSDLGALHTVDRFHNATLVDPFAQLLVELLEDITGLKLLTLDYFSILIDRITEVLDYPTHLMTFVSPSPKMKSLTDGSR